ncbi:MAG: ABC transporter permease [Chloroflexi bacterium]|nr:MAG: ABC transporter permease [Chloroflexota bacterium]
MAGETDPLATEQPPLSAGDLPAELPGELIAPEVAALEVPPELVAQSLGEYVRAWGARIRGGDPGVLPVILGLAIIAVLFQIVSPGNVFLSAGNLVNLFQQSAVFMVLGMAEIFVLLLGEIDLSTGYVAGLAGVIGVQLVQPVTTNFPWWVAIMAALLACAVIGAAQGTLVARLRLPSFVVTLGGNLIFNGVMLWALLFGPFSGYPTLGDQTNPHVLYQLMWGTIDPLIGWIILTALVVVVGGSFWLRDSRRRRSGLVAPPVSLTALKIVLIAVVGAAVVAICNINRAHFGTIEGVPWVILIVIGLLGLWTVLLQRTRFGRYIYAIGGNPEASRRAGINLVRVRTLAFVLCSMTAGLAGLLYVANQGGASNNFPGGQYVLYAVAAAVIGGTSLFGGRGRVLHGVLGGLVIGGINNGLYLLGLDVKVQFVVTGFVLLAAVTIDALSRRGASVGSVAHI